MSVGSNGSNGSNGNGHRRRVVVTGIGALTPIGAGVEGLWAGLRAERTAVGPITRFDPTPFRSHIAAEIADFVPADHLELKRARRLDRFGQFSVVAARMALDDARVDLAREDRERFGVSMGTALGGVAYGESQLASFLRDGVKGVDPALALSVFAGAASCNIALEVGAQGPNST
ncbi:MAG: beta-ketoacyl synthase N-terminal-like domain-containing protein, partial [Gemmatimonadaceae bacterium]